MFQVFSFSLFSRVTLMLFACLFLMFDAFAQNNSAKRLHVLMINSGNQYLPMERNIAQGLLEELDKGNWETVIYHEYLDSARFDENRQHGIFAEYLSRKYKQTPINLVISNGIPASTFLTKFPYIFEHIEHIFVRFGNIDMHDITNTIYIDASNNYQKSVNDMFLLAQPKKIVVLGDTTASLTREHLNNLRPELEKLPPEVEVKYVLGASLEQLKTEVENLTPGSIVLMTPIMRKKNGIAQTPYKTLNWLSQHSQVPIFTFWGSMMGSGTVGGYMLSGKSIGKAVADIMVDIAEGQSLAHYPQAYFNHHLYDWRQLKRFNLEPHEQFGNIELSFYQPTYYEKYRVNILLTVLAFLVLSIFIGLLLVSNDKRKLAIKALEENQDLLELRVVERTEELVSEKEKAEQASVAKSEFLANMSHEIRTPMNGVMGMLGLLKNTPIDDHQQHFIDVAQSSSQSLLTVINDILDFSKIEAGKLDIETIDFNLLKLIEESIAALGFLAYEKKLDILVDTKQIDHFFVQGDPNRIRQILNNLLSNAIKFTEQGNIVITAKTDKTDTDVNFSLSVKDSGIGVPEDKLDKLFTSFTQADSTTTRKYGGTGLGLSITKQLCQLMGGDITVESTMNQGSTFTIEIPLAIGEKTDDEATSIDISGKDILIIDDNAINREILISQLKQWGANVMSVSGGNETISFLTQETQPHIDIIIVDYQMPDMNGIELAKAIHNVDKYRHTKLLMMTSVVLDKNYQFYTDNGFSAYLNKPTSAIKLIKALAMVLAHNDDKPHALVTEFNVESKVTAGFPDKKLLLVEDNRVNQQVALGVIKHLNLPCEIANNGLEAVAFLESEMHFDIVLMDCQMPVMDGFEATKKIRSSQEITNAKNIPIIALTANSMAGDREKCLAAGMDDFLAKPIALDEVKRKIRMYIERPTHIND